MVRSIFDTNGIPYPAVNFVSTLALAIMKTYSGIVCSFSRSLVVVPNSLIYKFQTVTLFYQWHHNPVQIFG